MSAVDRKAAAASIEAFLRAIGRDPAEPDLAGTGARVADAYVDDLCAGYAVDVGKLLADEAIASPAPPSSIVALRGIAVTTMCPHHLMPATGIATVAFFPGDRIVGLGALGRLVDAYARRLTLQERIGEHVCDAIMRHLGARWAGCALSMQHTCISARGDRRHGTTLETISVLGSTREDEGEARHFMVGTGSE